MMKHVETKMVKRIVLSMRKPKKLTAIRILKKSKKVLFICAVKMHTDRLIFLKSIQEITFCHILILFSLQNARQAGIFKSKMTV
jgi:hypothetical protein